MAREKKQLGPRVQRKAQLSTGTYVALLASPTNQLWPAKAACDLSASLSVCALLLLLLLQHGLLLQRLSP